MSARSLSFASLLLAAVAPAFAGEPPNAQVVTAAEPAAAAPTLAGRWSHTIKGGELFVELKLVNTGPEAIDVLVSRGKMPGTDLQAAIDGVALTRVFSDEEMSGQMSRMGPMPRFAPVAAKREILAGTYRFQLPQGYAGQAIRLEATANSLGDSVSISTEVHAPLGV